MKSMTDYTLNQIAGTINSGLSVYYLINSNCAHSLGYLPMGKYLPSEDMNLCDELHRERLIATEWLMQDGVRIKDEIVPEIIRFSKRFFNYKKEEKTKNGTYDEVLEGIGELKEILSHMEEEDDRLRKWFKKIQALHEVIQKNMKTAEADDFYSWQDAAQKLEVILQVQDKMTVSWHGLLLLAEDALKDLCEAKNSPDEIIREMFCGVAEKQWDDVIKTAQDIVKIIW